LGRIREEHTGGGGLPEWVGIIKTADFIVLGHPIDYFIFIYK
jgi:hypothetical protein